MTSPSPTPTTRLRPHERIKDPAAFRRAFERRRWESDATMTIYGVENGLDHPRLGISVSRKKIKTSIGFTSVTDTTLSYPPVDSQQPTQQGASQDRFTHSHKAPLGSVPRDKRDAHECDPATPAISDSDRRARRDSPRLRAGNSSSRRRR